MHDAPEMSLKPFRILWACGLVLAAVQTPDAQPLPDGQIRVVLLGTGSPPPVMDRFGPSILVQAGPETLLFDVGRGAAQRVFQIGLPLRAVTGVFFTHLHSDHLVGFPDLWLTGWLNPQFGGRTTPLAVWGPAGTKAMASALMQAFSEDVRIRVADQHYDPAGVRLEATDVTEGVVFERNGVKVTAFDVDHGELIKPALGYRVDHAGRSVVLSGDTRFSENLIKFATGADVLIHEVAAAKPDFVERSAGARDIINHHTRPAEAGRVFERAQPRLAVYSHIALIGDAQAPAPTIDDLIFETRTEYKGGLAIGADLVRIDIGDRIEVDSAVPAR